MPSQEEYLDNLLKGIAETPAEDIDLDSLDLGDLNIPGMDLDNFGDLNIPGMDLDNFGDLNIPGMDLNNLEDLDIPGMDLNNLEDLDIPGMDLNNLGDLDIPGMDLDNPGDLDISGMDLANSAGLDISGMDLTSSGDIDMPEMDPGDLSSLDLSDIISQETGAGVDSDAESLLSDGIDMSDMDALLQSVGEEDVDKLLQESRQASEADFGMNNGADTDVPISDDDLMSLLNASGDDDLQEIQNLLEKSDNNEAVDASILAMTEGNQNSNGAGAPETEDGALSEKAKKAAERKRIREEKKEAKRLAKEAKKAAKAKKGKKAGKGEESADAAASDQTGDQESDISSEIDGLLGMAMGSEEDGIGAEHAADLDAVLGAEQEKEKEKKGFFTKILDFFTEEYEDEDDENENIQLSDENQAILNEMNKEKGKGKKKEKKPKKDKKGKKAAADAEGEEAAETGDGEEKKGKKKKKEKKPKEKPEADVLNGKPDKKLPRKRIILVAVVCASLTAVILIVTNLLGDFNIKKAGRAAYYEGDYQTCYQNLYGRDLNESEQVMYSRSECILRIRLWLREYEMLAQEGDRVKALDSLIQSVNDYPALYEYALLWNSGPDVSAVYGQMTAILQDEYHLTADQALEIAAELDDVVYTRKVTAIAGGEIYGSEQKVPEEPLKDVLPEEEGIDNSNFIDNNL